MSYIAEDPTKTAAKIRKELKGLYPDVKFSVRTHKYSMGSSVYVRWTDGPSREEVAQAARRFEGAELDHMQEVKMRRGYEWEGERYAGADFVFCTRTLSPELREKLNARALAMFGPPDEWGYTITQLNEAEADLERS